MVAVLRLLSLAVLGLLAAPAAASEGPAPFLKAFAPSPTAPGRGICEAFAGACARSVTEARPADAAVEIALAHSVSAAVNAAIIPQQDPQGIGRAWSLPVDGAGDCKHFVMQKKRELIRAGVPAARLLAAVVLGQTDELHAVLVLRTATGDYVLDSMTDRVLPWAETGYTFLKMQNPRDGHRWDVILEGPRARRNG